MPKIFSHKTYIPALSRNAICVGMHDVGYSDEQIQTIVHNASILDVPKFHFNWDLQKQFEDISKVVDAGTAINNPIKCFAYCSMTYWFEHNNPKYNEHGDIITNGWGDYANGFNADWLLKDVNGNLIQQDDNEMNYVIDLSNTEYQKYIINTVTLWVIKNPFLAGIKFDACDILEGSYHYDHRIKNPNKLSWNELLSGSNAVTDANGNSAKVAAWNEGLMNILSIVSDGLHAQSKQVLYNGVAPGSTEDGGLHGLDRNTTPLSVCDGAMNEAFAYGMNDFGLHYRPITSATQPVGDIELMKQYSDKTIIQITSHENDDKAKRLAGYALGGFLMGWVPGSSYWAYQSGYYDVLVPYPEIAEQNLALGDPDGDYVQSGNVLTRRFQHGFVAVNIGDVTETFTVPQEMRRFRDGVALNGTFNSGSLISIHHKRAMFFLNNSYLYQ